MSASAPPAGARRALVFTLAACVLGAALATIPRAFAADDPSTTAPPAGPQPTGPGSPGPAAPEAAAPDASPPVTEADAPGRATASRPDGAVRIGRIVVDGNVRVSDNAFFSAVRMKPGDVYDEKTVLDEFRRLWALQLFDDITVESRQRSTDVVDLIFHVRDRPLIHDVAYVGMKAITEANIQERLGQVKAEVRRGQPLDYSLIHRAESAIEQLLGEKGHLEARVRARLTPTDQGQREVTFHIHEGGKTKIKSIDFVGNTVLSDRKLRKTLKLTRQAFWLTSWASAKTLYHPAKFDQDAENIRTAYKAMGFLDISVKPEVVDVAPVKARQGKPPAGAPPAAADPDEDAADDAIAAPEPPAPPPDETRKQRRARLKAEEMAKKEASRPPKKWVYLTVPLEEGTRYRVGAMEVEGNSVFSGPEIMARVPLRPGMVFNDSLLKFATKRIEEDYGERGYFYVSLDPQVEKHGEVADLKLSITEDKKYFVDRIEFTGNNMTRDRVLRREVPLAEQDLFNVRRLRLGLRKIAQLGYWQVGDDPAVKPREGTDRVDIEVQGVESNRNEIQVGGGVSGLEGGFFQASYATRNFLGRGEILSTFIQTGSRANRYSLNFTEPWFMGRPWTLGVSLFKRQTDYVGFRQIGSGGNVVLGRLLGSFSRFDVSYGFEEIDFQTNQVGLPVNRQTSATSSITSIYTIDTRNNFFRPTRGFRLSGSVEYAGGALGGDNYFVKPRLDGTLYLPGLARRHYIGLNASYGYVEAFGGRVVPAFERYYLGGERSLRVFGTREVSPERRDMDVNGNGFIDRPEDGRDFDLNLNGVIDADEVRDPNGVLDVNEDINGNLQLDTEDLNRNGVLDPGEDMDGDGLLDTEDVNMNGQLDLSEDIPDGVFTPFCPADDPNMNGVNDMVGSGQEVNGSSDFGNCRLDPGEDTNGDGAFGTVFPGGSQFVLFNAEYTVPLTETVELALFYDAGNAFDEDVPLTLNDMRVDFGLEMRFYLPVFQAPLRLIYGFIQNPRPGEDSSNFIFSIGTTF